MRNYVLLAYSDVIAVSGNTIVERRSVVAEDDDEESTFDRYAERVASWIRQHDNGLHPDLTFLLDPDPPRDVYVLLDQSNIVTLMNALHWFGLRELITGEVASPGLNRIVVPLGRDIATCKGDIIRFDSPRDTWSDGE